MQFKTRRIPKNQSFEDSILRIQLLTPAQLEKETIKEILKHRQLVQSDELVYQEWRQADLDSKLPEQEIERMRDDCMRRRCRTLSQQELLSYMLDLLGFIPKVPVGHVSSDGEIRSDDDPSLC